MLNPVAENLWEMERPLKAPGLRLSHRMTVARLRDGSLWVHSPVDCDASVRAALAGLGPVRHLVAPSRFHDLHWREWFVHFPDADFVCPDGMREDHPKLPFGRAMTAARREVWEDELQKVFVAGMPRINEWVFVHRASGTLIVADLVFNVDGGIQNPLGRLFLRWNGICDRVGVSRIFRMFIKDRPAFSRSVDEILGCAFDRIVPGHGKIVCSGGGKALERALAFARESGAGVRSGGG